MIIERALKLRQRKREKFSTLTLTLTVSTAPEAHCIGIVYYNSKGWLPFTADGGLDIPWDLQLRHLARPARARMRRIAGRKGSVSIRKGAFSIPFDALSDLLVPAASGLVCMGVA